ncbi:flavin reductase family protein [Agrobacterium rubi]|uniref:flavin reductase family protein n=1 Tax=Agrobacterium rubi TaxID=28099 RepID=UPI001574804C|nr:flavin reductase family protein [Agrobacterium rubi]NTF07712.1 flavin reductase family protein [Agrobacterium rubi]NTF19956.1 flavin reductase family protein [Agrobacterium rubi]NTF26927.1 flavin reductase family protein [Agrobacterium rubi]
MFYTTDTNQHGLSHDPFKAIVAPRPIGWIGSKGRDGSLNLAPYSFFNAVADAPKLIMFSSSGYKHSVRNVEETGVFTANLVSRNLVEQMNASSAPVEYGVNEFELAGLTPKQGELVDAPYVAEAYAALECRVTQIMRPVDVNGVEADSWIVFGQVVGIHLDESVIENGRIDMARARPVARMGYMDYCDGGVDVFQIKRPG